MKKTVYKVYILQCADGTYYTGITTDIARRLDEHNAGNGSGAKYTQSRCPVTLVYHADYPDRSSATREECRIKKLSRAQKDALIVAGE